MNDRGKIFSPSLKGQLKDCILAVIWPKKDIYEFFKTHSCPSGALKKIENYAAATLSRATMVVTIFSELTNQHDNGTLQFYQMAETLSKWDHFDEFWFTKKATLDLEDAKAKIEKLRISYLGEVDKARGREKAHAKKAEERERTYASMEEMRKDFLLISTTSANSQQRGYAFERFLGQMARYFDLKVTEPFRISGTQIDGTIKYDGENYIIEAKWHDRSLSDEPILSFCRKQEINMHGRGIFISINGVTSGCLSILRRSSVKNTIIIDGEDLALILSEMITLPFLLEKKVHAAQTRGDFYINPVTGATKIALS